MSVTPPASSLNVSEPGLTNKIESLKSHKFSFTPLDLENNIVLVGCIKEGIMTL